MRASELFESLSKIAYHYTSLSSAVSILASGEFQLSFTLGAEVEKDLSSKGYHYFMSTTRTKFGRYHNVAGNSAVMFNLDGNYYNSRYKAGPVDYWGIRDASVAKTSSEAEDRIFSKTSSIPIGGVTSIHVFMKPLAKKDRENFSWSLPGTARKVLLLAKKRGIPAYLYEDENAWRRQDPSGRVQITKRETLSGPDLYTSPSTKRRASNYPSRAFTPWIQLIKLDSPEKLGDEAKKISRKIIYPYDRKDAVKILKNDFFSAKKHNRGHDYMVGVKLLKWMQVHKMETVEDMVDFLANKWANIWEKTPR